METIIEIKSLSGRILFSFKKENNTLKDTVIEAVKNKVNLYNTNLQGINLQGAELSGANLRGADLSKVDLSYANLQGADLGFSDISGADLSGADLSFSDISGADLSFSDISNAYLCEVNFCYANLRGANLRGANLRGANLHHANLQGANLHHANLHYTNLIEADLNGAGLNGADLSGADLSNANLNNVILNGANIYRAILSGAKNVPFIPMNLPEGEFIGWKKLPNGLIVKLKILEDSKRSKATTEKCRCDKALVLEFQNVDGSKSETTEYTSYRYTECTYKVGEIVYADSWDENRWNECSHGIHFFLDRESVVNY